MLARRARKEIVKVRQFGFKTRGHFVKKIARSRSSINRIRVLQPRDLGIYGCHLSPT